MMRKQLLLLSLLCCVGLMGYAQSDGDYRSRQTGNWNTVTTWQVFNAGNWENLEDAGAGAFQNTTPTSASGIITLQAGIIVTVPGAFSLTIDETIVEGFGELHVSGTLTVANGTANDLEFYNDGIDYGYLDVNSGGIVILNDLAVLVGTDQGNATFDDLSTYRHFYTTTEGSIPIANWAANSLIEIRGYTLASGNVTATAGGNWGQTFGNFYFDSPINNSARIFDFAGRLIDVAGELRIVSTGIGRINLSTTQGPTIEVGTDLLIQGTSRVVFNTTGSTTINVGQDFIFNSTLAAGSVTNSTGTTTINITRDFSMNASGGQLILSSGSAAGNGTLNITRNFTITAGTLTETSSATGAGNVNFITAAVSTFSNSGTISNTVNFSVANGKTLNLGTAAITGGGSFTLNAGGSLGVGSTDANGAIQTGTTAGNIRVSGTRTYTSASNVIYNGTAAQFLGNGFPSNVNLEISNSNGVTNNNVGTTNVVGNLTLTAGALNIGNSNTLNIQSNFFTTASGFIGGDATSNLTFSGSGTLNTLRFATGTEFLNNLTVGRVGDLVLGSNLTISGTISLSFGNLDFSGRILTMNGSSITSASTGLKSSNTSTLAFGGSTFSGAVPFIGGNQLNNLTFATPGGTYTWNSPVTINNDLTLTAGALTHTSGLTMAANSTFFKGGGTITGASPTAATNYNVNYTGDGNTGVELPSSSTALNDLTVDVGNTLTLTQPITVNGTLRFESGTFNSGVHLLDLKGNLVSLASSVLTGSIVRFSGTTVMTGSPGTPTFGAVEITGTFTPNTQYAINGNLTNNGTHNAGTGTVTFGGTTTISGTNASSFNNIEITGTLNAPANMNLAGNFINNGTFNRGLTANTVTFNGTTSVSGSSSTNFSGIIISGTLNGPTSLNVAGNFTNNGTFNRGSGTVVFNGTSAQNIQGSALTEFNNITVTNATNPLSLRVQSNTDLRGTLTLSTNTIFDPDGSGGTVVFRLRSTADDQTADAAIATIPTGAQVSGNVTVQRYMSIEPGPNGTDRLYRNISAPVSGAAVSQIKVFIPVSGTFTGANHTGLQSMFQYNEPVITDTNGSGIADLEDGYVDFPDVADSETLALARGYNIFIRGNETPITTAGSALFEVRGPINTGPIGTPVSFPVSFTTSGNVANDGWNLVGNPFPSTIDWNAASGWSKGAGITATIYMRDNGDNPAVFATWNGVTGTNGGSRDIAMGQAFWVKSDGSGATTLSADERVKVGGTQTSFFREEGPPDNLLRITLRYGDDRDESVIHFRDDATGHFDSFADAVKLDNTTTLSNIKHFNLATFDDDNLKMAINSQSPVACGKSIKLDVSDVIPGGYTLDFSEFESFADNVIIELHDNLQGEVIDVRENPTYLFSVTDQANTYGSERFYVTFSYTEPEAINVNAPESICAEENLLITIEDSNPDVQYSVVKAGEVIVAPIAGNGNNLIIEVPNSKLQGGTNSLSVNYFLQVCDQLTYQKPVELQVVVKPELAVTDGSRCQTGEVTLVATGGSEGSYRWYETEADTEPITGATGSSFTTPSISKTKTYYVAAVNTLGCEGPRVAVKAEVVVYDAATISVEGEVLSSNFETGNQWYFNGDPIPGATGKSHTATENGLYTLEVTIGECSTSAELDMIVTGIETSSNGIQVYPNPTADVVVIRMESTHAVKTQIFNAQGLKVHDGKIEGNQENRISLQKHRTGIYFLYLFDGKKLYKKKIVKK